MECNKDEAVRAKEVAERKFLAKDFKGAKKFALKAQKLHPELDGISQMVMTLEVYLSAEEERYLHRESNWYAVLGVTPLADDKIIRKQFRKLALLLHPDKNKSIGAEGAFQLVSQAWSLLSDKSKRTAYDQRRGTNYQHKDQTSKVGSTPSPTQNGFYNFAKAAASKVKVPKSNTSKKDASSGLYQSRRKEGKTFWTVCNRCKMQYEYLRMYLNHHLLCPNCHEAYYAVEIDAPSRNGSKTSFQASNSQQHRESTSTQNGTSRSHEPNQNNFQWVPFSESNVSGSAVQAANMVQQAYEKVKRERQKAQAATRKEKNLISKRTMGGSESFRDSKRRRGAEDFSKEAMKQQVKCVSGTLPKGHVNIKQLLLGIARDEVRKKLNEKADIKRSSISHDSMCKQNMTSEQLETKNRFSMNKLNHGTSVKQTSVDVPDPDFHDFNKNRTEKSFGENQVWAVYDDDDGMPRHYAMIHDVISVNPFEVRMSWLRSLTHSSLGHVSWFVSGSSKTCGEFIISGHEICNSVESFSHKVRWTKCSSSKTIQIFPRKGDVWALYKNWSPEWNELTEDEVIHKYDMVEVLEDYDAELGVIVVPLVKVTGFKGVFHQHFDPMEIRRISKEEMSRFSHQVPSRLLNGQEGSKSLRGCCELDPAATPLEILQVLSKMEEVEIIESDGEIEFVKEVNRDENTVVDMVEGNS